MWRLSPAPADMPIDVADEDCAVPSPSTKRRRKVAPIPVPAETSIHLTEAERELQQRHECLTTALQLYQPASDSAGAQPGLRLILPPRIMDGDNPFTLCPLEVLATDCLHRRWVAFAQFEEILNGMPKTSDTRHPSPLEPIMQDQKTMFFGAYAQGPLAGE